MLTKQTTKFILESTLMRLEMAHSLWTVQGLGMMRLYLSPELRLHIWDSALRVPNVSAIHTHPWDFTSYVIAGRLVNQLYGVACGVFTHTAMELKCEAGGCLIGEPWDVLLEPWVRTALAEGQRYYEVADLIHESIPEDGTVTLVYRLFDPRRNPDTARVYWPIGTEWVSAEPRPATQTEVGQVITRSLARWF